MTTRSEKFEEFVTESETGRAVYKFPNSFGASVIDNEYSYGLEVAVLDNRGYITCDTPITDDVLRHVKNLDKALEDISKL